MLPNQMRIPAPMLRHRQNREGLGQLHNKAFLPFLPQDEQRIRHTILRTLPVCFPMQFRYRNTIRCHWCCNKSDLRLVLKALWLDSELPRSVIHS